MKCLGLAACILLTSVFSGCFQHTIRVSVKADGSGSIAVRQVITRETLAILKAQAGELPAFNADAIKQAAPQFGSGVRALAVKEVKQDSGAGYLAVYQFSDINQIYIPTGQSGYHFTYRNGTLTVKSPRPEVTGPAASTASTESDASFAKLLQSIGGPYGFTGNERPESVARHVLRDLNIQLELDLPGGTNTSQATYISAEKKNRVRLMHVNGSSLAEKPAAIQTLLKADGRAPVDVLLSGLPGVEMEPKAELHFKLQ